MKKTWNKVITLILDNLVANKQAQLLQTALASILDSQTEQIENQ